MHLRNECDLAPFSKKIVHNNLWHEMECLMKNVLVTLQSEMYMFSISWSSNSRPWYILDKLTDVVTPWRIITNYKRLSSFVLGNSDSKFFGILPDELREVKCTLVNLLHTVGVQLAFVVPFFNSIPGCRCETVIGGIHQEYVLAVITVGSVGQTGGFCTRGSPFLRKITQLKNKYNLNNNTVSYFCWTIH